MNEKSEEIRVSEIYGSVKSILRSVRPNYRVPFRSWHFIEEYIKLAKEFDIKINYTFNPSCLGNIEQTWKMRKDIQSDIDNLTDLGVDRFTVATPFLVEHFDFPAIELSTILNRLTIKEITSLCGLSSKIDKICLPIYINRDVNKLFDLATTLRSANVECELIVNEFCSSEGGSCVRRNTCYNIQSHGGNPAKRFNNYPVGSCIAARANDPSNWLRAPFILPQDMVRYHIRTSISSFKVTGRTHSPESILKVITYYMEKDFQGSLCELWGIPLEKVYNELGYEPTDIPVSELERLNFMDYFFTGSGVDCANRVCDAVCKYCRIIYDSIKKRGPHETKG